jgi:hypothetical protein
MADDVQTGAALTSGVIVETGTGTGHGHLGEEVGGTFDAQVGD